jgi:hypothetical protein
MKGYFLKKQLYLEKIKVIFFQTAIFFFKHFYLVNRMSPTKPQTRNTIILRHLYMENIKKWCASCIYLQMPISK